MALQNTDYLQPAELFLFYDKRRVLQLLSDTNVPVVEASIDTNTRAIQLIRAASSRIDARCQVGKRYSRTDLETIASDARTANEGLDPTGYATKWKRFVVLQQLTADLVFGDLMAVRGLAADQMKQLAPRYEEALLLLEMLYQGQTIFDLDGPKEAGVPVRVQIGKNQLSSVNFNRMFGIWPGGPANPYGLLGTWRY